MVQLSTLRTIALYGAVITIGSGFYFGGKIQDGFRKADYYKESLRILRANKAVVEIMGQPIKDGKIDLGNTDDNYVDGIKAQLAVAVKGPKESGRLYLWASRENTKCHWNVDRLELALKQETKRRLLVYDREKAAKNSKKDQEIAI